MPTELLMVFLFVLSKSGMYVSSVDIYPYVSRMDMCPYVSCMDMCPYVSAVDMCPCVLGCVNV